MQGCKALRPRLVALLCVYVTGCAALGLGARQDLQIDAVGRAQLARSLVGREYVLAASVHVGEFFGDATRQFADPRPADIIELRNRDGGDVPVAPFDGEIVRAGTPVRVRNIIFPEPAARGLLALAASKDADPLKPTAHTWVEFERTDASPPDSRPLVMVLPEDIADADAFKRVLRQRLDSDTWLTTWFVHRSPAVVDAIFRKEVRSGMTRAELYAALGAPRAEASDSGGVTMDAIADYGDLQVTIRGDVVAEVVSRRRQAAEARRIAEEKAAAERAEQAQREALAAAERAQQEREAKLAADKLAAEKAANEKAAAERLAVEQRAQQAHAIKQEREAAKAAAQRQAEQEAARRREAARAAAEAAAAEAARPPPRAIASPTAAAVPEAAAVPAAAAIPITPTAAGSEAFPSRRPIGSAAPFAPARADVRDSAQAPTPTPTSSRPAPTPAEPHLIAAAIAAAATSAARSPAVRPVPIAADLSGDQVVAVVEPAQALEEAAAKQPLVAARVSTAQFVTLERTVSETQITPQFDVTLGVGLNTPEGIDGVRVEFRPIDLVGVGVAYGRGLAGHRLSGGLSVYPLRGWLLPFAWVGSGYNSDDADVTFGGTLGLAMRLRIGLMVAVEGGYVVVLNPRRERFPDGTIGDLIDAESNPGGLAVGIRAGYSFGRLF